MTDLDYCSLRERLTTHLDTLTERDPQQAAFETAIWGANTLATCRSLLSGDSPNTKGITFSLENIHEAYVRLAELLNGFEVRSRCESLHDSAVRVADCWGASYLEAVEAYLAQHRTAVCLECECFEGVLDVSRYPSAETLHQNLAAIQEAFHGLPDVDRELVETELRKEYRRAAGSTATTTEGPCGHHQWLLPNGSIVYQSMQPAAWNMVRHLWSVPERSATFDELLIPTYGDPEHIADENAYGALRRAANNYFSENRINYRVTISKGRVSLLAKEIAE
jgi:hypothetical protein